MACQKIQDKASLSLSVAWVTSWRHTQVKGEELCKAQLILKIHIHLLATSKNTSRVQDVGQVPALVRGCCTHGQPASQPANFHAHAHCHFPFKLWISLTTESPKTTRWAAYKTPTASLYQLEIIPSLKGRNKSGAGDHAWHQQVMFHCLEEKWKLLMVKILGLQRRQGGEVATRPTSSSTKWELKNPFHGRVFFF